MHALKRNHHGVVSRQELLDAGLGRGAIADRVEKGRLWEVTIPAARTPRAPVRIYRQRLAPWETTTVEGIPVTTVARTLLDLARVVPAHIVRRAIEQATLLGLFDRAAVERVIDAHAGPRTGRRCWPAGGRCGSPATTSSVGRCRRSPRCARRSAVDALKGRHDLHRRASTRRAFRIPREVSACL